MATAKTQQQLQETNDSRKNLTTTARTQQWPQELNDDRNNNSMATARN